MPSLTLALVASVHLAGPLHAGPAAPQPEAADVRSLQDLAFLAGAWEGEDGDVSMREVWDLPRGDAMVGHYSMMEDGRAFLYELLVIEQGEDGPTLRIRHFNRGLEPWASEAAGPVTLPLLEVEDQRAVFEDPDRQFPSRIVYEVEERTLTVRLEPREDSDREPIELEFERVDLSEAGGKPGDRKGAGAKETRRAGDRGNAGNGG